MNFYDCTVTMFNSLFPELYEIAQKKLWEGKEAGDRYKMLKSQYDNKFGKDKYKMTPELKKAEKEAANRKIDYNQAVKKYIAKEEAEDKERRNNSNK